MLTRVPTSITIKHEGGDDFVQLYLDGEEILSANHDEHGWAGMSLIDEAAQNLGKFFNLFVEEE